MKSYKLLLVLSTVLFLISCSNSDNYKLRSNYKDEPAYGDMLVDMSIGDPNTLNPVLASDSASSDITGMVFTGLIKFDKDLNLVCDMAEKFSVTDGGRKIYFRLKPGIKWQDGKTVTMHDVKFTYDRYMDDKVKTAYRSMFDTVKSVKVINDLELVVTYEKPFAPALQYWGVSIMPEHLYSKGDFNTMPINRAPVGCGPYAFKKWDTARTVELTAFRDYFDGEPYISRYLYRIIPDQSVQFMELKSGGADSMLLNPDLFFTKADTKQFNEMFNKFRIQGFQYTYLGFNLTNPLFKDKKVRQAIAGCINTDEIVKGVMRGLAMNITGPFIPGSWAYNSAVKPYTYNTDEASKMLADAGWKKGKDGILEKDGTKFEFTILTNQGRKEREECAVIIQQQLSKVGIKVTVRTIAWNVFISEYINKKKFDAVIMGWQLTRDPDCYDIWHSSKTKEGEFNFVNFSNAEVDALTIAGRETYDLEKRKKAYNRIHEIIADEVPYVFLYSPYSLPAIHKRIHGIVPQPAGISYNMPKWYVPAELQKYRNTMEK